MSTEENNTVNEPLTEYNQPLSAQDIWKMFAETDRLIKENQKETKELRYLFTSQWGKLIESLVEGDIINILNSWGIPVNDTSERRKGNYKGVNYEFDIIARNGNEVVIIEVKTTLRPDDVKEFVESMKNVKTWLSEFKDKRVYGAMAYLTENGKSARMAEKQGLFTIRATGNSAFISNSKEFAPRGF